jgi:hypothetical protein
MSDGNEQFKHFEEQLKKKGVVLSKIEITLHKSGRITVGNLYKDPYSEKKSQ